MLFIQTEGLAFDSSVLSRDSDADFVLCAGASKQSELLANEDVKRFVAEEETLVAKGAS